MSQPLIVNAALVATFVAEALFMLLFPLVLGWWVHRRFGISWAVYGVGTLTFIGSQVLHIPFNSLSGLSAGKLAGTALSLPVLAIALGLSAGIFEEGARWLVLTFGLRRARGWAAGLQFGAGHGGGESIILGALVGVNLVGNLIMTLNPAARAALGPQAAQVEAGLRIYWGTAWYLPLAGLLERAFAITMHILMAILVMRAVTRRQALYFLAAVAAHTVMDAWAVMAGSRLGIFWTEAGLGLLALAALLLIVRLRRHDAEEAGEAGQPALAEATAGVMAPAGVSLAGIPGLEQARSDGRPHLAVTNGGHGLMIRAEHLSKVYRSRGREVRAVDDLNLEVKQGEVFGFLGPNGAGKTTTMRMLAALVGPSSGQAWVNGLQVGKDDTDIRRCVGILTESPGLYDRLSAEKNLTIFAKLCEVEDVKGQVEKYLRMLGLWDRRDDLAGNFSKGMRQKAAICRALLHEPKLLFLDEPTSGLDPEAAKLVHDFIMELKAEGRTIFLCTHNLDEADHLCDRIGVMKQRLIRVDTPQNLRQQLYGRKVAFHVRSLERGCEEMVRALPFARNVQTVSLSDGASIVVDLDDPLAQNPVIVRKLVEAGIDVQYVGELRASLEEVYLSLVNGGKR